MIYDGIVGNVTRPELVRLAGHYPAGYTHIEEHINLLKYHEHQRIIKGERRWDGQDPGALESGCIRDSAAATIDHPAVTDSHPDATSREKKTNSGYYSLLAISKQAVWTMKAAGERALRMHRAIRRINTI